MGSSLNGKQPPSYYHTQFSLFRWRADPNHNTHLPRLRFAPRQQLIQRHRFAREVEEQLQEHLFLDVSALKEGAVEEGEVIVFQQFAARLDELQGGLEAGECLYVLMGLMEGYEQILGRYGRTHIELSSCFVTPEGEVRAWLSDNPASNDLRQQPEEGKRVALYSSDAGVIKRLLELLRRLSSGSKDFADFWEQLRLFTKSNMLQNCSFSAVRKFINRYLFIHCVALPANLGKALKRTKVIRYQSMPSEEEMGLFEEPNLATRGQLSTKAQLEYQLLAPAAPPAAKNSSSFTMKTDLAHHYLPCETGCRTPKTEQKFSPLDSTFINSQMILSRGKENKKGQGFYRINHELDTHKSTGPTNTPQKKQPLSFLSKRNREQTTQGKISVKFHSRQPSVDQESTSMFITPEEHQTDFAVHYSYNPHTHSHLLPNQAEELPAELCSAAGGSNSAGKFPSQLLCRQVSGLVSNKSLSICESMGTFQSIENSKDSGYKGVLNKMGRTAKMLNIPTGKRLATFFKNADNHTQ